MSLRSSPRLTRLYATSSVRGTASRSPSIPNLLLAAPVLHTGPNKHQTNHPEAHNHTHHIYYTDTGNESGFSFIKYYRSTPNTSNDTTATCPPEALHSSSVSDNVWLQLTDRGLWTNTFWSTDIDWTDTTIGCTAACLSWPTVFGFGISYYVFDQQLWPVSALAMFI